MILLLLACSSHPRTPAWTVEGFDGRVSTLDGERPATVVLPAEPGDAPLMTVFLLGGYSWHAWELDAWMGLSSAVDRERFLLVLPTASLDRKRKPFWAATDTCCDWYGAGVDDAAYLSALFDRVRDTFPVDPSRFAVVGHSNGAFMGFRMACEPGSPLSALVSVAGSSWMKPEGCHADHPVSLLQVHGTVDDIMPWEGDHEAPAVPEVLDRWAARAGCTPGSLTAEPERQEIMADAVQRETTVSRYQGCAPGLDVALWRVEGADHYPAFGPEFVRRSLAWIREHPAP